VIWVLLLAFQQTQAPQQPSLFDKPEFAESKFEAKVDSGAHASAGALGAASVSPIALLGLSASRSSSSTDSKARAHHDEARRLEAAGQSVAAAALFSAAAESDPSSAHLLDAAVHLLAHGAPRRATVFLERGLRVDPRSVDLRLALGLSQFALGQHEIAKGTFLAIPDPRGLEGLALIIEAAPALAPSLVDLLERSPYHQALALLRSPDSDATARQRAESLLLRALDENPKHDKAWFELARLYVDQHRIAAAEQALRSAIQANPDHELAHFRLAQVYQRGGRKPQAGVHFSAYRRLHARRLAAEEDDRKRRLLIVDTER
jgi:tetratricopeptide (TPR) repeat protein